MAVNGQQWRNPNGEEVQEERGRSTLLTYYLVCVSYASVTQQQRR